MSREQRNLTYRLYPERDSWYGDLAKATVAGIVIGLAGTALAQFVPNEFGSEALVRGATGGSDGIAEGSLNLYRRYVRRIKEMGSTGWYASGKMFGAGFATLSDYLVRSFTNLDVYSKAASFIPALYSQGDQLLASFFLMGYHLTRNHVTISQRFRNFTKDAVALSSLGVYATSVGMEWLIRLFNRPDSTLEYWVENFVLVPLCVIPPVVGRFVEKRRRIGNTKL